MLTKNTVFKGTKTLSATKSIQVKNFPVKLLKEHADFFADQICPQFNKDICSSQSLATFKFANVTPVSKQSSRNLKYNYRILPMISKIFEKLIIRQLSNHFDQIFSKFHCGFQKGFSAQYCLHLAIDKWTKTVVSNNIFDALLTDLSKIFDCICYDSLVAKLHAYGISLSALKMIQDYIKLFIIEIFKNLTVKG